MLKYSTRAGASLLLSALALLFATGCPVVNNLPAPGRILTQRDSEFDRLYHLYVPTGYQKDRPVPLVVTCHGTKYWDTAERQLEEWKGIAEQKCFLLAAPELVGTSASPLPNDQEQLRRQRRDEQAILSIIRSIRSARTVDDTRIFLTGWSAGNFAVLYTGLRNPDIFRALAVRQGNFRPELFEPCVPFLDRYQPVLVMYGSIDLLKEDAQACIDWLRGHDFTPDLLERPGSHRRDPKPVVGFFADVVRHKPWIRIHAREDPTEPMRLRFSVKTSFEPQRYLWDFGDGQRCPMDSPEHKYEKPGLYTVKVALWAPNDKTYVRQFKLQVPRVRLGAVDGENVGK